MTSRTFRDYMDTPIAQVAGWWHPGTVLDVLTGVGLATSAGLNAYIPLLTVGLLSRYTDLITLPGGWQWLENGWMLMILALLLAVEMIADKIPTVDHVNDVVQTLIRPTAGGMAFGASAGSETVTVTEPSTLLHTGAWVPLAVGIAIALVVHGAKASTRLAVNAATLGVGAPVISAVEDGVSVAVALLAILVPAVAAVMIIFLVVLTARRLRKVRRSRRTPEPTGQESAPPSPPGPAGR